MLVVDATVWQQEKVLNIMIINTKNIHNKVLWYNWKSTSSILAFEFPASIHACICAFHGNCQNCGQQDNVLTLKWSYCNMEDNRNIT